MPHSDIHKKKLKKNLAIAGMIFLWCALIWMVTMIRIANAAEPLFPPRYVGKNFSGIGIQRAPVDTKGPFYNDRRGRAEITAATTDRWAAQYQQNQLQRHAATEQRAADRRLQADKQTGIRDGWNSAWHEDAIRRRQQDEQIETDRAAHNEKIAAQPNLWWDGWRDRRSGNDE